MEDQNLSRMFCTFIFRRFEASVKIVELYEALKHHMNALVMRFIPVCLGAQAYRELN
jgi:hypothetical protein